MTAHPPARAQPFPARPVVLFCLCVIVLLGLSLRLYRLDELVLYLGDQGRDMMVLSKMVATAEPVLLGPASGFGQFQRGPAYYYLLLAGWATGGGDPAGAAATLAVLDAGTIILLFVAGRMVGGNGTGLVAAALYAASGAVIGFSRAFSNPNVLAFFSILAFVSLALLIAGRTYFFPVLVGALVVGWQMHDQTWLLVLWSSVVLIIFRPSIPRRAVLIALAVALIALAPFLVYELQNDLANVRGISAFVFAALTGTNANIGGVSLPERLAAGVNITQGFLPADGILHWFVVGLLAAGTVILFLQAWRTRKPILVVLAFYALLPLFYLAWPGPLYASYLGILAPVPFLVLAFGVGIFMSISSTARVVGGAGVAAVCLASGVGSFFAIQNAVPLPESLGAARAGVAHMLSQVPSHSFLWRLEKWDPITHELQLPWRYLLEWNGAAPGTTQQADGFAVYMPADYAPTTYDQSPVIAGNRIVHLGGPTLGENAVRDGELDSAEGVQAWSFRTAPQTEIEWDKEQAALRLQGAAMTGDLMAIRRLNTEPDTDYAIEFDYRSLLSRGSHRVYFLCLDADRNFISLAPQPGGYELEPSVEWRHALVWVRTPSKCVRAILWLRQEAVGTGWFRNVGVRSIDWTQVNGQSR